jgi:hypothetical protein
MNEEFQGGDVVRIKARLVQCYRPIYSGRLAKVERAFVPMGAKDATVRLHWLHRKSGKELGPAEFFPADVLERVPPQEP